MLEEPGAYACVPRYLVSYQKPSAIYVPRGVWYELKYVKESERAESSWWSRGEFGRALGGRLGGRPRLFGAYIMLLLPFR